uniref:Uncharacterized protein n=1 Tax=Picea sitchensis TaxID=3332 RepID=B8LPM8_PICSI|nr:unknown [Picea sitchensis]
MGRRTVTPFQVHMGNTYRCNSSLNLFCSSSEGCSR